MSPAVIIVSGFLGAGKSHLIGRLAAARPDRVRGCWSMPDPVHRGIAPDLEPLPDTAGPGGTALVEASGLQTPSAITGALPGGIETRAITVLDGVNLPASLADQRIGPLIRAQIAAADCLVLSRGDVADISAAEEALGALAGVPVIRPDASADWAEALLDAAPMAGPEDGTCALSSDYAIWRHDSSAVLTGEAIDNLLRDRPSGTYRLKGTVLTPNGAADVQVFGRGRQTAEIASTGQTSLLALGPKGLFRPHEMDLAFSQAVVAASYRRGIIACR